TRRIADPLAPGPRVEPRAGKSRDLEREQIVTGRDARPAHRDHFRPTPPAQPLRPASLERRRVEKSTPRVEVYGEGMVAGARDVARDRVERLVLAREAIRATRVHQELLAALECAGGHEALERGARHHRVRGGRGAKAPRRAGRGHAGGRPPGAPPGRRAPGEPPPPPLAPPAPPPPQAARQGDRPPPGTSPPPAP